MKCLWWGTKLGQDVNERAEQLLKAAFELLSQVEGDNLCNTVFYDGADCDGYCLIYDILGLFDTLGKPLI